MIICFVRIGVGHSRGDSFVLAEGVGVEILVVETFDDGALREVSQIDHGAEGFVENVF